MTKIIYIGIAFLVVVMMLSNRAASSQGEESNVSLLAYVAILGCVIALVVLNVRTAAGQPTPLSPRLPSGRLPGRSVFRPYSSCRC